MGKLEEIELLTKFADKLEEHAHRYSDYDEAEFAKKTIYMDLSEIIREVLSEQQMV